MWSVTGASKVMGDTARSTLHALGTSREAERERETEKLYVWPAGSGGALGTCAGVTCGAALCFQANMKPCCSRRVAREGSFLITLNIIPHGAAN
ncbi:hypothetical protein E2C01_081582 [Portunus trituberculatus]|uniref:Uncharacterized protein n=1 Tax=Portunus trituberculatus TaxID=210409 RepID=A0A5B7IYJ1_PORTR|nr:hypothetical protein [Portunus trituberculatus]